MFMWTKTVQFGALQVTPRVCYSRPATEAQKTTSFIEVDEITLERKIKRLFTGWMFADSPALNAVEHPIYDVWQWILQSRHPLQVKSQILLQQGQAAAPDRP